jgi:hypothetical protein
MKVEKLSTMQRNFVKKVAEHYTTVIQTGGLAGLCVHVVERYHVDKMWQDLFFEDDSGDDKVLRCAAADYCQMAMQMVLHHTVVEVNDEYFVDLGDIGTTKAPISSKDEWIAIAFDDLGQSLTSSHN